MRNQVIKPMATALWLIKNTKLTFNQIATFCKISQAEINAMADGFEKASLEPNNPIKVGQLTYEEISRCEEDSAADLQLSSLPIFADTNIKISKKVYTSLAHRKNKISGALFLIEKYKNLPTASILKLTGATKRSIERIIDGTYPKLQEIMPKDPIYLKLCTQVDLNKEIEKLSVKQGEDSKNETK